MSQPLHEVDQRLNPTRYHKSAIALGIVYVLWQQVLQVRAQPLKLPAPEEIVFQLRRVPGKVLNVGDILGVRVRRVTLPDPFNVMEPAPKKSPEIGTPATGIANASESVSNAPSNDGDKHRQSGNSRHNIWQGWIGLRWWHWLLILVCGVAFGGNYTAGVFARVLHRDQTLSIKPSGGRLLAGRRPT